MATEVRVLSHAVDQAGDVLDRVRPDQLGLRTPCADWELAELVDHLVSTPGRFLTMMRGEQPDWGAAPPHVAESWGPVFRVAGDDLVHAWHQAEDPPVPADFQVAELALHTWDVASAIGYPVDRLDPEIAERGLAFLRANLTDDNRAPVFGAEVEPPAGAGPYERLAAFAGRQV
ncbi:maleylpyruvate isomerase family mycothiol-dependent enzyme [Nocardioides sp. MAH-18]|uniref:Maleylpyruvate isomerase family mycothiol-dependent enzyme n=1 Tax=Nocardioides agri TaxID=2682843 RepID=A0A6L6Y0Q0_9ACTN|nr:MULTISPECIES: maleylpyruvate isomerase family mycothiol-dependent enzyme [unclassified Nocardioides]MBA2956302.1 maleylpyruvate isomerase family mycothiol-dependent enzyme [Nocardioides sp. CGMCC 1.13656]MVQ51145.1 maleylpyruvate isomerase family mycothiol-dependent enzyme [Nocardioides sp. MAH-18]